MFLNISQALKSEHIYTSSGRITYDGIWECGRYCYVSLKLDACSLFHNFPQCASSFTKHELFPIKFHTAHLLKHFVLGKGHT